MDVKLTQYSHGAGCGCKISPEVLDRILHTSMPAVDDARLLVGNGSRDDAAVYDLGHGEALISTTDFFMPIVDDPHEFGRIAATNAISDVYAMGGRPVLAIAILGWPVDTLGPEVAAAVIDGARACCQDAGIALAGGHSIDAPEPIFGLAVNGLVAIEQLKQNNTARADDLLYLTKPLGIGVLSTAQKKGRLADEHRELASRWMCTLNRFGQTLAAHDWVHAMTDVTGFGLLGHLHEMASGSGLGANLDLTRVPVIDAVRDYLEAGCVPGGSHRNWAAYGAHFASLDASWRLLLSDPQTSGGLLVAVDPARAGEMQSLAQKNGLDVQAIGHLTAAAGYRFDGF